MGAASRRLELRISFALLVLTTHLVVTHAVFAQEGATNDEQVERAERECDGGHAPRERERVDRSERTCSPKLAARDDEPTEPGVDDVPGEREQRYARDERAR